MTDITPADPAPLLDVTRRPIDQNPAAVYLASLAPVGRRGQVGALRLITRVLTNGQHDNYLLIPWEKVRFQHAAAVRSRLMETYKPATVNHALSAIRGAVKAAWQLGLMTAEDYQATAAVKSVRASGLPAGRELSPGEIAGLMQACEKDRSPAGARDAAIISMMYAAGLRRAELITLTTEDYNQDAGKLIIKGKGNKERTAYLDNGALYALQDWLKIRGAAAGPLFLAINKSGRVMEKGITPQAVYNVLTKRGAAAGIEPFSPHDLRRTFVSDLLDAGADIATVAKMAGHASVITTARYDRRPEEAKQRAAKLLHVPYRRRK